MQRYILHTSEVVIKHKTVCYIFSDSAYDRRKPHGPQADYAYYQTKPLAEIVRNRMRIQQGIVYDDQ
jgi:hypothetical protein